MEDLLKTFDSLKGRDSKAALEKSLPVVVKGCRALEGALREALNGTTLRGLKNLADSDDRFYGARIRSDPDSRFPYPDEPGGNRKFLCIDAKGSLVVVGWQGLGSNDGEWYIASTLARDDYFRIQDLDGFVNTLRIILPRHLAKTDNVEKGYRRAAELANKVDDILSSS